MKTSRYPPEVELQGGAQLCCGCLTFVLWLQGGLSTADRIVAVSPGYAFEITTPEGGWGLEGMIGSRGYVLTGVLNGTCFFSYLWVLSASFMRTCSSHGRAQAQPKLSKGKHNMLFAMCMEYEMQFNLRCSAIDIQ